MSAKKIPPFVRIGNSVRLKDGRRVQITGLYADFSRIRITRPHPEIGNNITTWMMMETFLKRVEAEQ